MQTPIQMTFITTNEKRLPLKNESLANNHAPTERYQLDQQYGKNKLGSSPAASTSVPNKAARYITVCTPEL